MPASKPWMMLLLSVVLLGATPAWAESVHRTPRDRCNADADVDRLGGGKRDDLHGCFASVPQPHPHHVVHHAAHRHVAAHHHA